MVSPVRVAVPLCGEADRLFPISKDANHMPSKEPSRKQWLTFGAAKQLLESVKFHDVFVPKDPGRAACIVASGTSDKRSQMLVK
jgi:hypothetical protein